MDLPYRDKERLYQRVVAGIGWPGAKPGAVCVVGEEAGFRDFQHYLLAEVEEHDLGKFLKICVDLQGKYSISGLYGRLDEASLEYHNQWNKARRDKHLSPLYVSSAPFSDDGRLQYHLSIVKDKLRVEQKSLFLGEARVAGLLTEIQASELVDIRDSEHPLIASLCYAVSALVTWKYVELMPEPDSSDYDPLTFGLK
jgi:hypothetical protein